MREGDKVEFKMSGVVVNGQLRLSGFIDLGNEPKPAPAPAPAPKPKPSILSMPKPVPVGNAGVLPSMFTRGLETVCVYYTNSRWFLFSSVVSGAKRQLCAYDFKTNSFRTWDHYVVHCSLSGNTLSTIELVGATFQRYTYAIDFSPSTGIQLIDRSFSSNFSGDIHSVNLSRRYTKTDRFTGGGHYRDWYENGIRLQSNMPDNYSIYTLTMTEDRIGLAGILRIDERNGRTQIGPIYPVWCKVVGRDVVYPFGYEETSSLVGSVGDSMIAPGGNILEWGDKLRFGLTRNEFLHARWKPGDEQEAFIYEVDARQLREALNG